MGKDDEPINKTGHKYVNGILNKISHRELEYTDLASVREKAKVDAEKTRRLTHNYLVLVMYGYHQVNF